MDAFGADCRACHDGQRSVHKDHLKQEKHHHGHVVRASVNQKQAILPEDAEYYVDSGDARRQITSLLLRTTLRRT